MIPLRDDVPSRSFPIVTVTLIGLNVAAFFLELSMGRDIERFVRQAAVIPALYTGSDRSLDPSELLTTTFDADLGLRVLYAMFLHGGWAHILGNMLYLWIFGDNVEDRMGHGRFVIFYLLCGWVASYAHVWSMPTSTIPSLGASGAIAGVLGAYICLFPHARVVTLIPLGIFTDLVQLPAVIVLGLWFVQNFFSGMLSITQTAQGGGVAWWAHIGGFVAGLVLVWLFQSRKRTPPARDRWWEDEYRGRRVRGW
jgi:membrane associated rhomboid family serine protease